jgi:hypothetical protein
MTVASAATLFDARNSDNQDVLPHLAPLTQEKRAFDAAELAQGILDCLVCRERSRWQRWIGGSPGAVVAY